MGEFGKINQKANGDMITFEAETFSISERKIRWKGIIKNDSLEGTFIWHRLSKWYRVSKAPVEYWVKGQSKAGS